MFTKGKNCGYITNRFLQLVCSVENKPGWFSYSSVKTAGGSDSVSIRTDEEKGVCCFGMFDGHVTSDDADVIDTAKSFTQFVADNLPQSILSEYVKSLNTELTAELNEKDNLIVTCFRDFDSKKLYNYSKYLLYRLRGRRATSSNSMSYRQGDLYSSRRDDIFLPVGSTAAIVLWERFPVDAFTADVTWQQMLNFERSSAKHNIYFIVLGHTDVMHIRIHQFHGQKHEYRYNYMTAKCVGPSDMSEKVRVACAGGLVMWAGGSDRTNGILNVSRSLGDYLYKAENKQIISAEPKILQSRIYSKIQHSESDIYDVILVAPSPVWQHICWRFAAEFVSLQLMNHLAAQNLGTMPHEACRKKPELYTTALSSIAFSLMSEVNKTAPPNADLTLQLFLANV